VSHWKSPFPNFNHWISVGQVKWPHRRCGKQSRSIPLLANSAFPIWSTLYLLLLQTIILTIDSVTTKALWRFVHEVGQGSLLWVFRLRIDISRIPLLPPTFKSSKMKSGQYSQTMVKYHTFHMDFGCLMIAPKLEILHRSREWIIGSWIHVSLAQRQKNRIFPYRKVFWRLLEG